MEEFDREEDPIPDDIKDALSEAGFEERQYQRTAILQSLVLLLQGKNAELNLPPGTGKTIISQIVAMMWTRLLRERGDQKVLFLVPSTVLREQHHRVCMTWTMRRSLCRTLEVTESWLRIKRNNHGAAFSRREFWFALPGKFASAVRQGYIPSGVLDAVRLVIVDEYDNFSVSLLRAEYGDLRFVADFEAAVDVLAHSERRFLFLSATAARSPKIE